MKNMNRRSLLRGLVVVSAAAIPLKLMAQQVSVLNQQEVPPNPNCPPAPVKSVNSEITSNHGHEFAMTLEDLINKGVSQHSIKGRSGHPHQIQVTNDHIVQLMQGKTVQVNSSVDSGHSHVVTMKLVTN